MSVNVTYSDTVKDSGEDYIQLQKATEKLNDVVGHAAGQVKAEWDRTKDPKGRTLYTLRISDPTGSTPALVAFAPDELQNENHVRFRLYRLWGDLLQLKNQQQLQHLLNANAPEN